MSSSIRPGVGQREVREEVAKESGLTNNESTPTKWYPAPMGREQLENEKKKWSEKKEGRGEHIPYRCGRGWARARS